jgi:hypothetical protein
MSKVHLLDNHGNKQYCVVVHVAMPGGNNAAGHAWKAVWCAAGKNVTRLATGTAPGQISAEEAAAIAAGDVIELGCTIAAESGGLSQAPLNAMIDQYIADKLAELEETYRYYGYSY